jgi:hypothetical protein
MTSTATPAAKPAGKKVESTESGSVRAPKTTWAGFRAKAVREGRKPNRVLIELMEGYRRGVYKLPTVKTVEQRVYDQNATAPAAEKPAA